MTGTRKPQQTRPGLGTFEGPELPVTVLNASHISCIGRFFTTSATKEAPNDFPTLPTLPCQIFQHFFPLEIDTPPGPPKMLGNHKRSLSCILPHKAPCEGISAHPKPTSPLDSEAGRLLVLVSTQRLHIGPKLCQEVL